MSSALKNFFITFAISLIVFALLGFLVVAPALEKVFNFSDMGENSQTSSEVTDTSGDHSSTPADTSTDTSGTGPVIDENGDVFTAVVMCVDDNGYPLNMVFIDANAKTKQYIYCTIDVNLRISNEIGRLVPIRDMFRTMDTQSITQCITAITGIDTQYCLKFNRQSLQTVAALIPDASVVLNQVVDYTNPAYKDYVLQPGETMPDNYRITISNMDNGKVLLNDKLHEATKLEWLLKYNPLTDGSSYNALYQQIAKSLIKQFLSMENSDMLRLLTACESNLSLDLADSHAQTIFSYTSFTRHELPYPKKSNNMADWEKAIKTLREKAGSFTDAA